MAQETLFIYIISQEKHPYMKVFDFILIYRDLKNISLADSLVGHLSRVNSCRFCHSEDIVTPLLVTAADDGFVKIWDVLSRKIKQFHSKHLPAKITCVDWSTGQFLACI